MTGLTSAKAADLAGLTVGAFHVAMHRLRQRGVDLRLPPHLWPDRRSSLWDELRLREWLANRPSRGVRR